jgi:hypothetical protein
MGVLQELLSTIIIVLIEALFVHLAAMLILRMSHFLKALTIATIATALAYLFEKVLVAWDVQEVWILLMSLAIWLATTAIVYRTTWVRSLAVAILAFALWWGTTLLVEFDWRGLF